MNETLEEKKRWMNGESTSDYNDIRFAKDKFEAGKAWMLRRMPNVDMEKPRNIVDYICKYKYEDLNPDKVSFADKIAVYGELYDMGLEELHIPMIGPYEKFWYRPTVDDVHEVLKIASKQPSIIKCNHGSGWNVVIPDGNFNADYLTSKLMEWLHTNYAYVGGYEWHYEHIVPGLLIQPLLKPNMLDWQFYCLDGEIVACDLQKKYSKSIVENVAFVGPDGGKLDWYIGKEPSIPRLTGSMKQAFDQMIPYVKEIASKFKFVRVDLFNDDGKIYFCEATFAPCSGILDLTNR